ncbi:hypothetical protein GCM10027161_66250 [Microbispora hainanensis]
MQWHLAVRSDPQAHPCTEPLKDYLERCSELVLRIATSAEFSCDLTAEIRHDMWQGVALRRPGRALGGFSRPQRIAHRHVLPGGQGSLFTMNAPVHLSTLPQGTYVFMTRGP